MSEGIALSCFSRSQGGRQTAGGEFPSACILQIKTAGFRMAENSAGCGDFREGRLHMREIRTEDAVGQMLCHDITQIIPGISKGPVFCKGHVIQEADIPVLLSAGKDHVYILEEKDGMLHENDAAAALYALCENDNITSKAVKEGKIEAVACCDGLLKVDSRRLREVNGFSDTIIATRRTNSAVRKDQVIAGMKVIPLFYEKKKMEELREKIGPKPLLSILPYRHKTVGIVVTGNEVFYRRIPDGFTSIIHEKLSGYDVEFRKEVIVPDDLGESERVIREFLSDGCDLILCTGGMSIDPDDKTPLAIRNVTGAVVSYGTPVLPGAMFLLSYYGEAKIPILGLPGGVLFSKKTVFDLLLPRIMADDIMTREDIADLGEGGLL